MKSAAKQGLISDGWWQRCGGGVCVCVCVCVGGGTVRDDLALARPKLCVVAAPGEPLGVDPEAASRGDGLQHLEGRLGHVDPDPVARVDSHLQHLRRGGGGEMAACGPPEWRESGADGGEPPAGHRGGGAHVSSKLAGALATGSRSTSSGWDRAPHHHQQIIIAEAAFSAHAGRAI